MPPPGRLDSGVDFDYAGTGLPYDPFEPSGMQRMGSNRHISALFRKNTRFDVTSAWAKSSFSSVLIIFAAGAPVAGQARKLRHIWGEVDRKVLNRPKQHW
jgi:hypothetical protein